jgi:hypothetical protein
MKTTILNLSAVAIIVSTSFFAGRIQKSDSDLFLNAEEGVFPTEQTLGETNVITRATMYEGEIIPSVTLPEFTVEADRSTKHLVHATLYNGEIIPYVELPTFSIEG